MGELYRRVFRGKVVFCDSLFLFVFFPGQVAAFLTIEQVRDLDLGHGEKPDYFNCKSTITFSKKDNCLYKVELIVFYAHEYDVKTTIVL